MREMVAESTEGQSIRDAIQEAVGSSQYVADLDEEANDIGVVTPSADESPAAEGEESGTGDGQDGDGEPEVTDTGEPPLEYWGTSLEGLSAEQRSAVIAALEQRDSTIQQLQQKLTKEPELPAPVEEEDVEITDADILAALGVNLEDPYEVDRATRELLPMGRQIIALEERVEELSSTEQVRSVSTFWNSELDRLESEYGKLPGDRLQVLNFAADQGIGDPEVLYFRLTAPGRKAIEAEVAKVRQEAARKVATGQMRPRSTDKGARVLSKELSLRDTVKQAALDAQEESGQKWSDIFKRKN